jgi:hypothetical protein
VIPGSCPDCGSSNPAWRHFRGCPATVDDRCVCRHLADNHHDRMWHCETPGCDCPEMQWAEW